MKHAIKPIKIVIDTNLFVSLLIGKKMGELKQIIASAQFQIVVSEALIEEIREVSHRPKFVRYFNLDQVEAFLDFLTGISVAYELHEIPSRCRDPKDDFLLELAIVSESEFLLTGDADLLEINRIGACKILTVQDFLLLLQTQEDFNKLNN